MERSVVSLETAKKLKAAGFPQDAWFWWLDNPVNGARLEDAASEIPPGSPFTNYAAPTAQEIADQLPEELGRPDRDTGYLSVGWDGEHWTAWYDLSVNHRNQSSAPTMAEALALLWLKLHAPARQLSQGEANS